MIVAASIEHMRKAAAKARSAGRSIGLVPTMGALHEGHLSLIRAAKKECGFTVVSIFVNPIQFAPGEDYQQYPRPQEADLGACDRLKVDVAFCPDVQEMYPAECLTTVTVGKLSETLCGAVRPGHFAGVCTVVAKLFNIVQPDTAFFGSKDFQQSAVIRRMVNDLNFPLEVVVCPTVREKDGLAMSSRNVYLTAAQRNQAPSLHGSLRMAQNLIRNRRPPAEEVIAAIEKYLTEGAPAGTVEYVKVVDPETLADVRATDVPVLIALAVRFGRARLIDNMLMD